MNFADAAAEAPWICHYRLSLSGSIVLSNIVIVKKKQRHRRYRCSGKSGKVVECAEERRSGGGFKNSLLRAADNFRRICAFFCVHQKICFQQNLIVRAVHTVVGVMMSHQIDHPIHHGLGQTAVLQKVCRQNGAFSFLIGPVGAAVFFPAEGAGDVVDNGGGFQCGLGACIQPFLQADGAGVGVDLQQVVDIVEVSVGLCQHALHDVCNDHSRSPVRFVDISFYHDTCRDSTWLLCFLQIYGMVKRILQK